MSTPTSRPLLLLALSCLLLLSGCLTNTKLRGLAVQLVEVQATPVPGGGADLTLNFRYLNENNIALAVATARHRVTIGAVTLGRVDSTEPIGLPRLAAGNQPVTVRIDAATAARLRELQQAGTATYRLETTIIVEAAADKLQSRTSGSGTLDLTNLGL
jgi:hypothetical protein